jgi:uncharacterized membrane protein YqhA
VATKSAPTKQKLPLQEDVDWRAALKERPFLGFFVLAARGMMLLAIVGTFVMSAALVLFAIYDIASAVVLLAQGRLEEKKLLLEAIEAVDTFLIVTVMHVVGIGLYQLYIQDNIPIPEWVRVETIDDLKTKLAGVVIVVLAVFYLGRVITGDNAQNLLFLGGGVGLAIASLSVFLYAQYQKPEHKP